MAGKTLTDVIGSDLEQFRKDENGKARTAEEIIQAAVAKGLKEIAPENRGSNTSDEALTNTILAQIKANAERNAPNTSISADVYKTLGGSTSQGNFARYLDPSQAKYQDKVGQLIKRPGDQYESLVLDRNQKTISKEELDRRQNFGTTEEGTKNYGYIDPITGQDVFVNPFTGEIDWNRVNDPNAFTNQGGPTDQSRYSNMGRTTFDPVTGLAVNTNTGTGFGSTSDGGTGSSGGSIYAIS